MKKGISRVRKGQEGPLNDNLKVSWLKSERKEFGKIEKSRWCCGARSLKGEDRLPAGPRALLRWFQSRRNRLGGMKKFTAAVQQLARWCNGQGCGAPSPRGRGSILS